MAQTNNSLVVCIAYPWEGTQDRYYDEQVRRYSSNQDCIVSVLVVDEYQDNTENKPGAARNCTTRVNAAQVLQCRGATEPEPKRRPLRISINKSTKETRYYIVHLPSRNKC